MSDQLTLCKRPKQLFKTKKEEKKVVVFNLFEYFDYFL